jgi:general secretion pathway protein J
MRCKNKYPGFTLIEVLVALFIFAIVSTIMVSALHTLFSSQQSMEQRTNRFADIEMALILLSNDFEQIINRSIRVENGDREEAVIGSHSQISFTHAGLINSQIQPQSNLQRSNYSLKNGSLIRTHWTALDRTSHTKVIHRQLLNHVKELNFEYIDNEGHIQDRWPMANQASANAMPQAIRITLTLDDLGNLSQTYLVSGSKIEKP